MNADRRGCMLLVVEVTCAACGTVAIYRTVQTGGLEPFATHTSIHQARRWAIEAGWQRVRVKYEPDRWFCPVHTGENK